MKAAYIDLIERYLRGELNPEQEKDYLQKLESDPDFLQTHQIIKAEFDAMEMLVGEKLKQDMAGWKDNPPPDPFTGEEKDDGGTQGSRNIAGRIWWGTLLLLVAAAALIFLWPKGDEKENIPAPDQDREFADTAILNNIPVAEQDQPVRDQDTMVSEMPERQEAPPVEEGPQFAYADVAMELYDRSEYFQSTLKSGDDPVEETPYQQALALFEKKKLKSALAALNAGGSASESNTVFLTACILFEMGDYSGAAKEFERITKDELLPVYEDARWYLLLSYAATLPESSDKYNTLMASMQEDPDGYYYNKVQELKLKIQ